MFEYAEELRKKLRKTKNKQLTELAELLEMQEELDKSTLKQHGITEYPEEEIRMALSVEIGEMLNEVPTIFKYWEKTAQSNIEKALEKYVDILHFVLSLSNFYIKYLVLSDRMKYISISEYEYKALNRVHPISNENIGTISNGKIHIINDAVSRITSHVYNKCKPLFDIGSVLGFTWERIYKDYKDKNAVNYQRLKEGY